MNDRNVLITVRPLEDGYRAYQKREPLSACPFERDLKLRSQWMHGWVSAYHNRAKR